MENKTKTVIIIAIIVAIILIGAGVLMSKKGNIQSPQGQQASTTKGEVKSSNPAVESVVPEVAFVGTTMQGLILSKNKIEIFIDNTTQTPTVFAIDEKTLVFKLAKDGTETPSTQESIVAGGMGKVLYDETEKSEKKVAKKIFLIER